jgi:hypothetical protein
MYIKVIIRPNIAHTYLVLAQFLTNLELIYLAKIKHI